MSFGQAEKPCDNFRHWMGNGMLCGRCAWERADHSKFPVINEIVFALIFDNHVVGYKKWSEEHGNWTYCKTYNRQSAWSVEPLERAYSQIELAFMHPKIER